MGSCDSKEKDQSNKGTHLKKTSNEGNELKGFIPEMVIKNQKNIKDFYQIEDLSLGSGAYGEVKLAVHKLSGMKRAVKIIAFKQCTPQ